MPNIVPIPDIKTRNENLAKALSNFETNATKFADLQKQFQTVQEQYQNANGDLQALQDDIYAKMAELVKLYNDILAARNASPNAKSPENNVVDAAAKLSASEDSPNLSPSV
jgi:predicted  nucleic acid-binding Zn-ribbon protein